MICDVNMIFYSGTRKFLCLFFLFDMCKFKPSCIYYYTLQSNITTSTIPIKMFNHSKVVVLGDASGIKKAITVGTCFPYQKIPSYTSYTLITLFLSACFFIRPFINIQTPMSVLDVWTLNGKLLNHT